MVRLASIFTLITLILSAPGNEAEASNEKPFTLPAVVITPDTESKAEPVVSVFKDPVVNQIKFRYKGSNDDTKVMVQLQKTSGITLQAFSLTKGLTRVNTTSMKSGLYKYRCVTKNGETLKSGNFTVLK